MWQWVARGTIQQISYIPQTEQHEPEGRMLLRLGNATIMCVYVCVYVCMYVLCVCMYVCMYVCVYVCVYVHACMCVCTCMYVCMCVSSHGS